MLALHRVMANREYKIAALITTVTDGYDRISMHGVRINLLEEQADSLGIPLELARIPQKANNEQYEASMLAALAPFAATGIKDVICGDLYLADIREYREKLFAQVGMRGVYPLWLEDTRKLAEEFITLGYRGTLCCVDPKAVPDSLSGREFDDKLLADLPAGCDPCGENGEFHSFVYDGPLFKSPVKLSLGEFVTRDGFCFTDLLPAQ
jgi:uncharacterized protein (TIGR00290 family)